MVILDKVTTWLPSKRVLFRYPLPQWGQACVGDAHIHGGYNRYTANLLTSIRSHGNYREYDDGTEVWDSLEQMKVVRTCYSGNCVKHKGVIMPIHYNSVSHTQCGLPAKWAWGWIPHKTRYYAVQVRSCAHCGRTVRECCHISTNKTIINPHKRGVPTEPTDAQRTVIVTCILLAILTVQMLRQSRCYHFLPLS
jgi:hypothetical protein